jgi:MFS family permease
MIESFNVPKHLVGQWAGIIFATYAFAQVPAAIMVGHLSDRIGRKPVILLCLVSTLISTFLWGLSTNIPLAVITRAAMGFAGGDSESLILSL